MSEITKFKIAITCLTVALAGCCSNPSLSEVEMLRHVNQADALYDGLHNYVLAIEVPDEDDEEEYHDTYRLNMEELVPLLNQAERLKVELRAHYNRIGPGIE